MFWHRLIAFYTIHYQLYSNLNHTKIKDEERKPRSVNQHQTTFWHEFDKQPVWLDHILIPATFALFVNFF